MGAGRPVRRRRRARHPAPALRALHHQGAVRHRATSSFTEPFSAPAEPGHGAARRLEDVARARATWSSSRRASTTHGADAVRAGDGVRRARRGRHRLGGRLARRVARSSSRAPGASRGDVTSAARRRSGRTGDAGAAPRRRTACSPTRPGLVEAIKFNVVVARLMELVNATRKAIDTGPGPAIPRCARRPRSTAMILDLFAPHTAEEMWETLGYEPFVALVAVAQAPTRRCWSRSRVTAIVQVDGKVRDRLEVSPTDRRRRARGARPRVGRRACARSATARSSTSSCAPRAS